MLGSIKITTLLTTLVTSEGEFHVSVTVTMCFKRISKFWNPKQSDLTKDKRSLQYFGHRALMLETCKNVDLQSLIIAAFS